METNANYNIAENEKLIDIWGKRNPRFEKKYEYTVLRALTDYSVGASDNTSAKGKILGAGYEAYIMAFFIGLYSDKKLPLPIDNSATKTLGQPLSKWGNVEARDRKAYPRLRTYIFMALVAKSNVDWIALDKGEITASAVVSTLINTMEEYANYGFSIIEEKIRQDKDYFYSDRAFLDLFLQLTKDTDTDNDNNAPEAL